MGHELSQENDLIINMNGPDSKEDIVYIVLSSDMSYTHLCKYVHV